MRFKVLCEHGAPVVAQLDLTTTAAKTNFGTIYTDAWESHVVSSYRTEDGHDHALIYADGVDNGFVLGESLTPTEDVLSETNGALMSGGISVTYIDPMQKAPKPDWITMLHEYTHSLGAVQDSAPHSSDYSGHCTDGPDIMCSEVYGDNNAHACTFVEFDCNGDDYFNPAPKPSSYLASHWNVGSPLNFYIERGTAPADRSTPTPPRNLRVSRGLLRWSPATDDIGVLGYRIDCNTAWRGWFPIAMTPNLRVSTKVCNRAVRVRAVDAAGRTSLPAALKRRR
jgi:hypothetical protein